MTDEHGHEPVLVDEILEVLRPRPGEVAVDCTVGRGGHAVHLAARIAPPGGAGDENGLVVGFDLDEPNLAYAGRRVERSGCRFLGFHESFVRVEETMVAQGLRADVVLADLGASSTQMDDADRGFSFRGDGPLDMRLDRSSPVTAADVIARSSERELAELIREYGEEPLAGKIARKLAQTRRSEPIQTTAQLVRVVLDAYGGRAASSRMHPATRTFMALRIAVNEELDALAALLEIIGRGADRVDDDGWLRAGARVAIVSFHSLEDRLVKRSFATLAQRGLATRLTRKPVIAGGNERERNVRSRSAKMRAIRVEGTASNGLEADRRRS